MREEELHGGMSSTLQKIVISSYDKQYVLDFPEVSSIKKTDFLHTKAYEVS